MNELLITMFCAYFSGYADVCLKTAEAASKQVGLHEQVEKVESELQKTAESKTVNVIGKDGYKNIGYAAAVGKIGLGESAQVKIRGGMICDTVVLSRSKEKNLVLLNWNF